MMKNGVCPFSQKPSNERSSKSSSKCLDCILFTLWISHANNENSNHLISYSNDYAWIIINPTTNYSNKQWKPPKIITIS